MKKIIIGIFTVCLFLVGCSNDADEPLKDQVIEAMENKEFEKALTLIEGNPTVDEETKKIYVQLQEFKEVTDVKSRADWDGVLEKAHVLLENPSLENGLKIELEEMIVEAEMEINNSIRENFEQNSAVADEEGNPPPSSVNLKERYLAKLADMEDELEAFDKVFEHGTQIEITEAQAEVLARWDGALNEIYAELKKQLSPDDMSKLRAEQRDWLKSRDEKAAQAALEYKGGSMETLQYVSTQAQLTRDRSYELVELYMK